MRKWWGDTVKKIQRKGNERLTFMLIRHNHANIFNLQLTKYGIFITFLAVMVIVFSSALANLLESGMKGEVSELHDVNRAVYNEREQYMTSFHRLWENQTQLRKELSEVMVSTELAPDIEQRLYSDDLQYLRAQGRISTELTQQKNQSPKSDLTTFQMINTLGKGLRPETEAVIKYDEIVINFKKLHLELKQNIQVLHQLNSFLRERNSVQNNLPYHWPMAGGHFTSFFGPRLSPFGYTRDFHAGIDLAGEVGTPIYAAAEGRVLMGGYFGGYGVAAKIQHRYGFITLYAHMSTVYVRSGQMVSKGQLIGRVGATGRVTGPHLHYEIHLYNRPIDPLPYLTSG